MRKQPATRSWWSRSNPASTSIEDYGYQLGRSWGIGQKGRDTGVLADRRADGAQGANRGRVRLEGTLTDATSRVIIERIMIPAFRSGQFGPGIVAGVGAILKVISGEAEPVPDKRAAKSKEAAIDLLPAILIFGGFILFMWLAYRNRESGLYGPPRRRRGTWIGYGGGGFGGGFGEAGAAAGDSAVEEEVSAAAELPEIGDMPFLTADDIRRIDAVEAAEERTAAEFVTVIAHSSGSYLPADTGGGSGDAAAFRRRAGFALAVHVYHRAVLHWPGGGLRRALRAVPMVAGPPAHRARDVQRDRARLRAHELFLDLGLVGTRDRTGVLFFISVAEHYVEIIADRGVSSVVDDKIWMSIVADFTSAVRQGRIADGFLKAIEACTRSRRTPSANSRRHQRTTEPPGRIVDAPA